MRRGTFGETSDLGRHVRALDDHLEHTLVGLVGLVAVIQNAVGKGGIHIRHAHDSSVALRTPIAVTGADMSRERLAVSSA